MSSPVLAQGKLVAVKCDGKLVLYTRQHRELKRTLRASESEFDRVTSPYTQFYVEPSKEYVSEGLVHIRSCYNNKYWVPRTLNDILYVLCEANEPQEDRSQDSCTLFKVDGLSHAIRYMDKTTEKYVAKDEGGSLVLTPSRSSSKFGTMDLGEALTLPKDNVCFKSEVRNAYVASYSDTVMPHLPERGSKETRHSIHIGEDGTAFRIKSEGSQKFWKVDDREDLAHYRFMINSNAEDHDIDDDRVWFQMVKLGDNTIALKNKGTNKFVAPGRGNPNNEEVLFAIEDRITELVRLRVEVDVMKRKIYDMNYDLEEARVYDRRALVMAVTHASNSSSVSNTAKVTLKYSFTTETTWNKSTTDSWGVSISVQASLPKLIPGLELGFELERHEDHAITDDHGGSYSSMEEQSVDYELTVPAHTKVTLQALATQASCDIPYSYWQEDVLHTGEKVSTRLEDGIFHAVKSYDFTYKVTEEKLADGKTKKAKDKDDEDDGGDDDRDDDEGEEDHPHGGSKGSAADGQRGGNMNAKKINQEEEEEEEEEKDDDDDAAEKKKRNKNGTSRKERNQGEEDDEGEKLDGNNAGEKMQRNKHTGSKKRHQGEDEEEEKLDDGATKRNAADAKKNPSKKNKPSR